MHCFAPVITHRKLHLGSYGEKESRSLGRSLFLELDYGWPKHARKREVEFGQKAVRRALSSLNMYKSSGVDGISPLVHRSCASERTPVLTLSVFAFVQLSRRSPRFAEDLPPDSCPPDQEEGDGFDPSNVRSIIFLLSKVMETFINSQILVYLEN